MVTQALPMRTMAGDLGNASRNESHEIERTNKSTANEHEKIVWINRCSY